MLTGLSIYSTNLHRTEVAVEIHAIGSDSHQSHTGGSICGGIGWHTAVDDLLEARFVLPRGEGHLRIEVPLRFDALKQKQCENSRVGQWLRSERLMFFIHDTPTMFLRHLFFWPNAQRSSRASDQSPGRSSFSMAFFQCVFALFLPL